METAGDVRDFEHSVETLSNLLYLMRVNRDDPAHMREYLDMADRSLAVLVRLARKQALGRRIP